MIGDASYAKSTESRQPWERFIGVQATTGEVTRLPMSPKFEDPRWDLFYEGFSNGVPFVTPPRVSVAVDGSRFGLLTIENNRPDGGVMSVTTWSVADWSNARTNEGRMKVELSKRISFKGEPISATVRDSALAAFLPQPGRPTEGPAEMPKRFQDMARERMPSFMAPAEGLLLGLDKTVWTTQRDEDDLISIVRYRITWQ